MEEQFLFLDGNMRLLQRHILAAAQRLTKALYHAVPVTQPEFRVDKLPCFWAAISDAFSHNRGAYSQRIACQLLIALSRVDGIRRRDINLFPLSISLFHHR